MSVLVYKNIVRAVKGLVMSGPKLFPSSDYDFDLVGWPFDRSVLN
jgi:hypothetical protein